LALAAFALEVSGAYDSCPKYYIRWHSLKMDLSFKNCSQSAGDGTLLWFDGDEPENLTSWDWETNGATGRTWHWDGDNGTSWTTWVWASTGPDGKSTAVPQSNAHTKTKSQSCYCYGQKIEEVASCCRRFRPLSLPA